MLIRQQECNEILKQNNLSRLNKRNYRCASRIHATSKIAELFLKIVNNFKPLTAVKSALHPRRCGGPRSELKSTENSFETIAMEIEPHGDMFCRFYMDMMFVSISLLLF